MWYRFGRFRNITHVRESSPDLNLSTFTSSPSLFPLFFACPPPWLPDRPLAWLPDAPLAWLPDRPRPAPPRCRSEATLPLPLRCPPEETLLACPLRGGALEGREEEALEEERAG